MNKLLQEELNKYADALANNHFLVPNGWGDHHQLSNSEHTYRTYCNDKRAYMQLESHVAGIQELSIILRKENGNWKVTLSSIVLYQKFNLRKAESASMDLIKNIYSEIHCIDSSEVELKKVREAITEKTERKLALEKEINDLKLRIKDYNQK